MPKQKFVVTHNRLNALPLLAIALFSFGCSKTDEKNGKSANVESQKTDTVVRADKGDVLRDIVVDGQLYSPKTRSVTVEQVHWFWDFTVTWTAAEGSLVKKGELIAKLDAGRLGQEMSERQNRVEQEQLSQTQEKMRGVDSIADARSQVVTAEFNLRKAQLSVIESDSVSEMDRKKQLVDVSAAEAALRNANERVTAAKAMATKNLQAATLRVKKAQDDLDTLVKQAARLELKAPEEGILFFPMFLANGVLQKARPGTSVNVGNTIAEIAGTQDLVARFFVPELDIAGVAEGAETEVTLDIEPDKTIPGKVVKLAKLASTQADREGMQSTQPSYNVRQFEVQVSLAQLPPNAIPGLTARARITTANRKGVTRIPIAAINAEQPKNGANGETKVKLEVRGRDQSAWEKREVVLGLLSLAYAEIRSGLKPEDEVMVRAGKR